jgi:hypothetical protein
MAERIGGPSRAEPGEIDDHHRPEERKRIDDE